MNRFLRILKIGILGLLVLIVAAVGMSLLSNRGLPAHSNRPDRLDSQEKACLAEALHLKQTLGESLWPAWGHAEIPVLVWNEKYGFLVGEPDPLPGWEQVPEDDFLGSPYYRLLNPKR